MVLYSATISVTAICVAMTLYSQIAVFINCYYTNKYIGHSWWKQQQDYWPYIILSTLAVIPGYILTFTELPDFVVLVSGISSAAVIYLGLLLWKKDTTLLELFPLIENKIPFLRGVFKQMRQRLSEK